MRIANKIKLNVMIVIHQVFINNIKRMLFNMSCLILTEVSSDCMLIY